MDDLLIPKALIGYLYNQNFGNLDPTLDDVDDWVETQGFDKATFWRTYELLIKAKILRFVQDEGTVRLTPKGTLQAEKMRLASASNIARNRDVRKRLMSSMANYLRSSGTKAYVEDLAADAGLTNNEFIGNLQLLIDMGYGRWTVVSKQLTINPKVCSKAGTLSKVA